MRTAVDQVVLHESKCQQQITACAGLLVSLSRLKILNRNGGHLFILRIIRICNQLPVRRYEIFGRRNSLDNRSLRHISKGYLIQRFIKQIVEFIRLRVVIGKSSGLLLHDVVALITFHEEQLLCRHVFRRIIIQRHTILALVFVAVHITVDYKINISVLVHIRNVDIQIRVECPGIREAVLRIAEYIRKRAVIVLVHPELSKTHKR